MPDTTEHAAAASATGTRGTVWLAGGDPDSFEPDRIAALEHSLSDNPVFTDARLLELAQSLGDVGHWQAKCPWTEEVHIVKQKYKLDISLEDAMRGIETSQAYVYMADIQRDPAYAPVVASCFDSFKAIIDAKDPGMHHRRGWFIVSSPESNCPYHRDSDSVLLLQIRGKKRVYVWDPHDESVCSQRENEVFCGLTSQKETNFRDELLEKARVFDLEPGMGVYQPFGAPHVAVVPEDGASYSLSLTYLTEANLQTMGVHSLNRRLRSLGLSPAPPGRSAFRDSVKYRTERLRRALMPRP